MLVRVSKTHCRSFEGHAARANGAVDMIMVILEKRSSELQE